MKIDDLNSRDRQGFVEAVGWVFEDSPWVAERAWAHRPFPTVDALREVMVSEVGSATPEEQLALLRAHPDLGAVRLKPDTTGRVRLSAVARSVHASFGETRHSLGEGGQPESREMSDVSQQEQARAGLDSLSRSELERLGALNAAYRDKFGFPFLYAVRGATPEDILNALEKRLLGTRDVEVDEALRQVYRIARFRLEGYLS